MRKHNRRGKDDFNITPKMRFGQFGQSAKCNLVKMNNTVVVQKSEK